MFLVCTIAQEFPWRKEGKKNILFLFLDFVSLFEIKAMISLQVKGKWTLQYMDSEVDIYLFNIHISHSDLCFGFLALLVYWCNVCIFTTLFYHLGWKSSNYTGIVGSA